MNLDGHNIGYLGIKKESTFGTNPIPDFTDGTPTCNPLIVSQDGSFDVTINDLDNAESKSLNGQFSIQEGDIVSGRFNYTLTMTGNILKNGMGFVLAPFFQNRTFSTNMIYKYETTSFTCPTESYTIYIPIGCAVNAVGGNGAILTGCKPISLDLNGDDMTWTATFEAATYDNTPSGATELPVYDNGDYNLGGLTLDKFAMMSKSGAKLTLSSTELETTSVNLNVEYTLADNKGYYNSEGVQTGFRVLGIKPMTAYSVIYDTTDTATNKSLSWLSSHKDKTTISDLGVNYVDNVNNSIKATFDAVKMNSKPNNPGADLMTFDTEFHQIGNPATTLFITVDDEYGDITSDI